MRGTGGSVVLKYIFKHFIILFIILLGVFWFNNVDARSYYYDSMEVEITVNEDSTFDVTEKMTYNLNGDFGFFYRDLEMKDLDHFSDVQVFDNNGKEIFEYDKQYNGRRLHLQWNFPRREYYNELKSWTIKYRVHGGLGFFDDYDEIYWNAVFHDRDVGIDRATVTVNLPAPLFQNPRMFIGELGNNKNYQSYIINGNSIEFKGENIGPGEYLTIVATWPKGFVAKPFIYRNQLINLIVLFIALLIPIITFIKAFGKWYKDGRDPKITKTVIAHYEPPHNISPAVMGVLLKESVDVKDILATVVNLAVRGYIRITEEEKKILFIKNKEYIFQKLKSEADLKPFEQLIMKAVFGGVPDEVKKQLDKFPFKNKFLVNKLKEYGQGKDVISSTELRNKFYSNIPLIEKEIHKEVAKEGLFNGNLQEIRKKYSKKYFFGLLTFIITLFIIIPILAFTGLSLYIAQIIIIAISIIVSSIIGLIFSHFMPVLSQKGLESKWETLGFREYLHTAERFRIGAETLETFSKFLPYAMVLKVEKEWAERFSDFSYKDQGWYVPAGIHSGSGVSSSFSNFSSSFSSFTNSISSTFSSSPGGSGSGGGAGGGGGGGGGGAG